MDDNFLHRIRVDPPERFVTKLKTKLDGQGVAPSATRRVLLQDKLAKLGPIKGISFQTIRPSERGPAEVYNVTFEHGGWTWELNAGSDGKMLWAFSLGQPNWDIGSFSRRTSEP